MEKSSQTEENVYPLPLLQQWLHLLWSNLKQTNKTGKIYLKIYVLCYNIISSWVVILWDVIAERWLTQHKQVAVLVFLSRPPSLFASPAESIWSYLLVRTKGAAPGGMWTVRWGRWRPSPPYQRDLRASCTQQHKHTDDTSDDCCPCHVGWIHSKTNFKHNLLKNPWGWIMENLLGRAREVGGRGDLFPDFSPPLRSKPSNLFSFQEYGQRVCRMIWTKGLKTVTSVLWLHRVQLAESLRSGSGCNESEDPRRSLQGFFCPSAVCLCTATSSSADAGGGGIERSFLLPSFLPSCSERHTLSRQITLSAQSSGVHIQTAGVHSQPKKPWHRSALKCN